MGTSEGDSDSRSVVHSSAILDKIERSVPVEYDNWIVVGDLSLSGRTLGTVHFNNTIFQGNVSFEGTNFTGDAWFSGAKFCGYAYFVGAEFNNYPKFNSLDNIYWMGGSYDPRNLRLESLCSIY